MQHQQELTLKAFALAKSSPVQWQEFLRSLYSLLEENREKLVTSPLTDLQVNQGRAQALSSLFKVLADCQKNAEQMKKG